MATGTLYRTPSKQSVPAAVACKRVGRLTRNGYLPYESMALPVEDLLYRKTLAYSGGVPTERCGPPLTAWRRGVCPTAICSCGTRWRAETKLGAHVQDRIGACRPHVGLRVHHHQGLLHGEPLASRRPQRQAADFLRLAAACHARTAHRHIQPAGDTGLRWLGDESPDPLDEAERSLFARQLVGVTFSIALSTENQCEQAETTAGLGTPDG